MKISVIKSLVENNTINQLKQVEEQICNGDALSIAVEGADDGEKLTHVLAAIDILTTVENENMDIRTAMRAFSERVRNSIS